MYHINTTSKDDANEEVDSDDEVEDIHSEADSDDEDDVAIEEYEVNTLATTNISNVYPILLTL